MSIMAATVSSSGRNNVGPKHTPRLLTVIRFFSLFAATLHTHTIKLISLYNRTLKSMFWSTNMYSWMFFMCSHNYNQYIYTNNGWQQAQPYTYHTSSSVICQTTGPKPLAKRLLHTVRSRASSFNSQYPLLSLRSSSNLVRLIPCFLVTSIWPFIFPSITCFRRQFLRKMWPIQLAFRFIISCRIFLCYWIF